MDKKKKRSITRGIILVILALAIVYTVYTSATKDKIEVLKEGEKAPDFELVDMDGNKHRLSNYEGQGVFLNFWGTWCEPCKEEMPAMERQFNAFKDQGIQMFAINVGQSEFEVQTFVDTYQLTFPFVIDKAKDVQEAYNIFNLPATVLVDPDGNVVQKYEGPMDDEKIASFLKSIMPE